VASPDNPPLPDSKRPRSSTRPHPWLGHWYPSLPSNRSPASRFRVRLPSLFGSKHDGKKVETRTLEVRIDLPSPPPRISCNQARAAGKAAPATETLKPESRPASRPFHPATLSPDHRNSRLSRSSTATGLSPPTSRNYTSPPPIACAGFNQPPHAPWKYGFCQLIDRPSPDTSRLPAVVPQMTLLCSGRLLPKLHTTGGAASPLSFPHRRRNRLFSRNTNRFPHRHG
jgi:hypothetical protein